MPRYRVEIQRSAERDLDRLAEVLFERIVAKLTALADDPRPASSQKLTGLDAYRIRVGEYRVVYEIDDDTKTIVVTRVRHRREVYRKLR